MCMHRNTGIRYLEQPPYEVLYTNWISYGEIRRLKRIEEMVELYYNSGQFTHTLPVLEKAYPGPFAMYEALADYYQEQGILPTARQSLPVSDLIGVRSDERSGQS